MKHKKTTEKVTKTAVRIIAIAALLLIVAGMLAMFTGCNQQIFDTTWSFERAIIFLPDGEKIEGKVTSWKDFESSDMIQVVIDGNTYLTHSTNVILISE
jgi:hypothetical protein